MAISKAQQKAVEKYKKNNYDRLYISTPKGKKEEIKDIAEKQGESLNGFINKAIDERIKKLEQE